MSSSMNISDDAQKPSTIQVVNLQVQLQENETILRDLQDTVTRLEKIVASSTATVTTGSG